MNLSRSIYSFAAGAILVLSACQPNADQLTVVDILLQAEIVYRDDQCLADEPALELISEPEALRAWWDRLARRTLPPRDLPLALQTADLEFSTLVVYLLGSRPTPGYSIDLASDSANMDGDMLTIRAEWQSPPADAMLAQVMTSPCAVIEVPVRDYARVRIVDGGGAAVIQRDLRADEEWASGVVTKSRSLPP